MANETTSSNLSGIRPTQVANTLIPEVRDNAVAPFAVDWRDGTGVAAVSVGRITSTAAVTAITTGTSEFDGTSARSQVTTSANTFTPAAKAIYVLASFLSLATTPVNMAQEIRNIMSRAHAVNLDTDILALSSGFSNGAGTSGVDASLDDARTAATLFRTVAGNRSSNGVWFLHPQQESDLIADAMSRNSPWIVARNVLEALPGASREVQVNFRGMLLGYPVIVSSYVPTANASADRAGMLIVPPSPGAPGAAIGGAMIGMDMQEEASGISREYPAKFFGSVSMYAVGEEKDEFGVNLTTDA